MKLELALEHTGLTWSLNPDSSYEVGNDSNCDILLPYVRNSSRYHLKFSYKGQTWYVENLSQQKNSLPDVLIDDQRVCNEIPLEEPTRIKLATDGLVILAVPNGSTTAAIPQQTLLTTSTRLLSGSAYRQGIVSGFELLNQLRSDPYTSKVPKSSIDLDQVATHATQSVLISLIFAISVLAIFIIQIFIFQIAGFQVNLLLPLAIIAGGLTAYEIIYLRWSLARCFLKKYYDPKFCIKFLKPSVNYFKQYIYQDEPSQNIFTFGGFKPFVGSGEPIPESSWTLPIDRIKKDSEEQDRDCIEIPTHEFYQAVDKEISRLRLPSIQSFSYMFVNGFELETDGKLLTHSTERPAVAFVDNPLWNQEQNQPASQKRAYRVYRYVDTERDYVLSHFLRFYNAGSITFVESAAYILTGIDRKRFSLAPTLDDSHFSRWIKVIAATFVLAPLLYVVVAVWYIGIFIFNLVSWKSNDDKQRRAAEFREEYNYGVEQTLREFVAEPLNLDPNQSSRISRPFKKNRRSDFNFSFKKLLANPLLLIVVITLSPILVPTTLIFLTINWSLTRYRDLNRDFSINLDYYGTQDVFLYWKATQDAIFNGTINLLKQKGVDTSKFEQASSQISNNSITVNAGSIIGSQFGAGAGSSLTMPQSPTNSGK